MKKPLILSIVILLVFQQNSFAWGQTGHRVVGEIAWQHLSKKAKKNVQRILGHESLAMCANHMDFIKSDSTFDSYSPWHYCTLNEPEKYAGAPAEGDVLMAIELFTTQLKTKNYTVDEAFALKCLVHLVGDLHQPLHVGNGTDRGGNDVKLEFFGEKTNLHRIWDSQIIDNQQLSYTEYTNWIGFATPNQITEWQSTVSMAWAAESRNYHPQVYTYPENGKLGYRYVFDNIALVNQRLLQAGIRLAGILNKLYA